MSTGPMGARRQPVATRNGVVPSPMPGLPYEVRAGAGTDLAGWAAEHPDTIDTWLSEYGAVLFRGFGVDLDTFAGVARALAGPALSYQERSTPRSELRPGVYTSTEYPPDQSIPLHNENAYQRCFPERLVFGCTTAPGHGGATPLADTRRVLARLDPAVVSVFRQSGVSYVRNYHEGAGLSWQEAFGCDDPGGVDAYCAEQGITARWMDGVLRTEQVRPATARHPRTGEEAWFNHVNLFHPSALAAPVYAALVEQFGVTGLPLNALYGDGRQIEPEVLAQIRDAYAAEQVATPWRRGDVLLIDNLLVAHGREPYAGPRRIVVSMAGRLCHGRGESS